MQLQAEQLQKRREYAKKYYLEHKHMNKKLHEPIIPRIGGVYRIPMKHVWKKKTAFDMPGDPTWEDIYGSAVCHKCKKHLVEGDAYIVKTIWKMHANGSASPIHKYQHAGC